MERLSLLDSGRYGYDFVPPEYLPPGKDEYWLRNLQTARRQWRALGPDERAALEKNGCRSGNWDDVLVCDPFDPSLIWNTSFYGLVRLGILKRGLLKHHDFCVPAGIRDSTIISCDIGDNAAIQNCPYIAHYSIADNCILSRVDELAATNHAKFGSGVIKDGESEELRTWIDVMNEAGGRSVLPFPEMLCADAYIWAAYRDDREFTEVLKIFTQESVCSTFVEQTAEIQAVRLSARGFYGTIGAGAVLKSCRIIKDAAVGAGAYIKGANKLKNITVLSTAEEAAQIGEGVELVNGIVGYGSHIFYGVKAVRFVIGRNCNLKYGARLIHSILGDNSTVSCCEILNNLVFPVHEQHHNNSFLIASLLEGMSNMAAGATIGSNHNSRANDGELRAGRGFWPGLSVTLKHSSRIASFCLIVKGDYPYELNITLPFSLVNNNVRQGRLEVLPAYFWMYNLYALERNTWKTRERDRRRVRAQRIETEYLAPDTAEEIIRALEIITALMDAAGMNGAYAGNAQILQRDEQDEDPEYDYSDEQESLPAQGLERHSRPQLILKPRRAVQAYREMLFYYGMRCAVEYLEDHPGMDFTSFAAEMESSGNERVKEWVNLGGHIVPAYRVDRLREDVKKGRLKDWNAVHAAYDTFAAAYPEDKARHGWAALRFLASSPASHAAFAAALDRAAALQDTIAEQVYLSRAKDFHDPFRKITYRSKAEMNEVAGNAENNPFVKLARKKSELFRQRVQALKERLSSTREKELSGG